MKMKVDMLMRVLKIVMIGILILSGQRVISQDRNNIIDYTYPDDYVIGNVTVSGVKYLDSNAIIGLSGLRKNSSIQVPGDKVTEAVEKLWGQGLFSDVKILVTSIRSDTIELDIFLSERPRISSVHYFGLKKMETDDISEKVNLLNGSQITDHVLNSTRKIIIDHFTEKGFMNCEVRIVQKEDPDRPNNIILNIHVDKNNRIKISEIYFEGNQLFTTDRLRRVMKNTKKKNWNIFKSSKFIDDQFDEDKESLITFYNDNGYRDFEILKDSVFISEKDRIAMVITVKEGG
ncbi:MAG: outer membrane protein assembly factor BamA, partial [Bacteroidales bacterium]|nr:outer membrane protein assembly factor BamA [Bacteroidales bacterium]